MAEPPSKESDRSSSRLGVGATTGLIVCSSIWGFNQVAIKVANEGFPPVMQAAGRSVLAGALLLI
ncbi:MAG: hypothetical protein F9K44_13425, partial [Hyphomicrobiaceae bacterium]